MSEASLHQAVPADMPALEAHEADCFPGGPQGPYLLAPLIDDAGAYLWRGPAGDQAYALIQGKQGAADAALVFSFAVLPGARGQGVGRAFLRALLARLDDRGITQVSLYCAPENQAALRLYRGAGFLVTESLPAFYGPGEDRVRMRRDSSR